MIDKFSMKNLVLVLVLTGFFLMGVGGVSADLEHFNSTWNTALGTGTTVTLPLINHASSEYNFTVDWGDGTIGEVTSYNDADRIHDYGVHGIYNVTINGTIEGWSFNNGGDKLKLIEIKQWGPLKLGNSGNYFYGTINLNITATDILNTTGTISFLNCFLVSSISRVPNMDQWDMSNVENMQSMFNVATNFNENISGWNTSSVTTMAYMFYDADSFNQPLNDWDVSKVTTTFRMFENADSFNGSLAGWNLSSLTTAHWMFRYADVFNGNMTGWIVGDPDTTTTLEQMFTDADAFNQPIGDWDVSAVTDMAGMFYLTDIFNQSIGDWDVSGVTRMESMFNGAKAFNQPIKNWDVSSVTTMAYMFLNSPAFNQDLDDWDVSSVTTMESMFEGATAFNGSMKDWDLASLTTVFDMFLNANNFNGNMSNWTFSNPAGTSLTNMFNGADGFNQDLNDWNTSGVTDMQAAFTNLPIFNGNISNWDTSRVTTMRSTFQSSPAFNQDLDNWDTSSVTDMQQMFYSATAFNGSLANWDVSNVNTMYRMFYNVDSFDNNMSGWSIGTSLDPSITITLREMFNNADKFNQDLDTWDVSNVDNMLGTFANAFLFNGNVSNWDTSSTTTMQAMFTGATSFNQDIGDWNTSSVTTMREMFDGASSFNGSLANWDVSNVENMYEMFKSAVDFNNNLTAWQPSKVTNMNSMFHTASDFNQDVSGWDVGKVQNMDGLFYNTAFDQNLGDWNVSSATTASNILLLSDISTENYDSLLTGWASLSPNLQSNVNMGTVPSQYSIDANESHYILTNDWGWTINDGDMQPLPPEMSWGLHATNTSDFRKYDWIFFNVTSPATITNVNFTINNASGDLETYDPVGTDLYYNWTDLPDGNYSFYVTIEADDGGINSVSERNVYIDSTNPLISYNESTSGNDSYVNQDNVYVEVDLVETFFSNLTFTLYDDSMSVLNSTTFTDSTREINWTSLDEGVYYYKTETYDSAINFNETDTRKITLDSTYPLLSYSNSSFANDSYINYNSVYIEVDLNETNLQNITFELFDDSFSSLNSTTFSSETTSINWTGLTMNAVYYYNVSVLDKVGFSNYTETRVITLDNVAPVVSNYSWPVSDGEIGGENVLFNWTVYDNYDLNITCYPTSNGVLLTDDVTYVVNGSDGSVTATLPGGVQYINVTCYDDAGNSHTSAGVSNYLVAQVTFANPTITDRPSQIVRLGEPTIFRINETSGEDFITNITLTLSNSSGIIETFYDWTSDGNSKEQYSFPSYEWNFASPQYITMEVVAFNDSVGSDTNVTESISLAYLRQSVEVTGNPQIIGNYANTTYNMVGDNVTIVIVGDLDTLFYNESLSVVPPSNNSDENLSYSSISSDQGSDYLNYINYTYNLDEEGEYMTSASIQDFEGEWANYSYGYFYAVSTNRTINLTSENNIKIKDVSSGATLWDAASMEITIPTNALYDVESVIEESGKYNLTLDFDDANFTTDYYPFMNYTSRTNETAAPGTSRRVALFDLETDFGYDRYDLIIDYSPLASTLTDEADLKLYKCSNVSNCELALVDTTLNVTANTLTANLDSMSRFMLVEEANVVTEIETVTVTTSGGSRTVTKYASLEILTPGKATMELEDEIILPLTLKNPLDSSTLNNVRLSGVPNTQDLSLQFDRDEIDSIVVGGEEVVNMIVQSHSYPGEYEIDLNVSVDNPDITQNAKVFIRLVEDIGSDFVNERIVLVQDLFKENPQCLEFNDYLIEAERLLDSDPEKAKELVDYAIQGCKDLISSQQVSGENIFDIVRGSKGWEKQVAFFAVLLTVSIIIVIWFIFWSSKRKHKKKFYSNVKKSRGGLFSFFKRKKSSGKTVSKSIFDNTK